MQNVIKITDNEFKKKYLCFNLIVGATKSNYADYYELNYNDERSNKLLIGIINNYPNMDLDPQVEMIGNQLIIGNNETLTIFDVETKETKEFPVFPCFYKFIIRDNRIIVLSETEVFCLYNYELVWSIYDFKDMICLERMDENKLILSTYEDQKEIAIDINTGKII